MTDVDFRKQYGEFNEIFDRQLNIDQFEKIGELMQNYSIEKEDLVDKFSAALFNLGNENENLDENSSKFDLAHRMILESIEMEHGHKRK